MSLASGTTAVDTDEVKMWVVEEWDVVELLEVLAMAVDVVRENTCGSGGGSSGECGIDNVGSGDKCGSGGSGDTWQCGF